MASKANYVLNRAIQATEMHAQMTSFSQGNKVPNTILDQKTTRDGDGVYRFLYQVFALPPEIREFVWRYACGGDHTIRLGGSEVNGIISVMLALKDPRLRSEGVIGVWKSFHVEWERSLNLKAWQRFKKTVIPHVRCLTINFTLSKEPVLDVDSEMGKTVAWMSRRGKPGYRARYNWHLEQLHLVALKRRRGWNLGSSGYYLWKICPFPGSKHWSEHWALNKLRKDGLKVTAETKHDVHRALLTWP